METSSFPTRHYYIISIFQTNRQKPETRRSYDVSKDQPGSGRTEIRTYPWLIANTVLHLFSAWPLVIAWSEAVRSTALGLPQSWPVVANDIG